MQNPDRVRLLFYALEILSALSSGPLLRYLHCPSASRNITVRSLVVWNGLRCGEILTLAAGADIKHFDRSASTSYPLLRDLPFPFGSL